MFLIFLRHLEDQRTLFASEERVIHWAVDRYQNAVRRYEGDRFNDAIVRCTQVVEILCIYQIHQIQEAGELTDENHDPITCPEVVLNEHWSITKLIRFLFKKHSMYERRYRIANRDKHLNINDYDGYNEVCDMTRLIKHRKRFCPCSKNSGHGKNCEQNAENLRDLAWIFLKNFSLDYRCGTGLSFDDLLELHQFSWDRRLINFSEFLHAPELSLRTLLLHLHRPRTPEDAVLQRQRFSVEDSDTSCGTSPVSVVRSSVKSPAISRRNLVLLICKIGKGETIDESCSCWAP